MRQPEWYSPWQAVVVTVFSTVREQITISMYQVRREKVAQPWCGDLAWGCVCNGNDECEGDPESRSTVGSLFHPCIHWQGSDFQTNLIRKLKGSLMPFDWFSDGHVSISLPSTASILNPFSLQVKLAVISCLLSTLGTKALNPLHSRHLPPVTFCSSNSIFPCTTLSSPTDHGQWKYQLKVSRWYLQLQVQQNAYFVLWWKLCQMGARTSNTAEPIFIGVEGFFFSFLFKFHFPSIYFFTSLPLSLLPSYQSYWGTMPLPENAHILSA